MPGIVIDNTVYFYCRKVICKDIPVECEEDGATLIVNSRPLGILNRG